MNAVPLTAIRKLVDYGMPLGATNSDWAKWRDEVVAWLDTQGDDWSETVDYLLAHAPEPEPDYDIPEPPEDWDKDDFPHYDTPGGW